MYEFNVFIFLIVLIPLHQWLKPIQDARRPPPHDVLTDVDDPRNSYFLSKLLHSMQEVGHIAVMRVSQLLLL